MSKNNGKNYIKKIICRCEEITEEEIREAIREGYTTIKAIKIRTRAGMKIFYLIQFAPLYIRLNLVYWGRKINKDKNNQY
jgi:hypothetical protein